MKVGSKFRHTPWVFVTLLGCPSDDGDPQPMQQTTGPTSSGTPGTMGDGADDGVDDSVATDESGPGPDDGVDDAPPDGTAEGGPTDDGGSSSGGNTNTCAPAEALAIDCTPDWYGDGECDPSNNFGDCEYDGGDCCENACTAGDDCGYAGYDCRDPAEGGYGDDPPPMIGDPCAKLADPFDPATMEAEVALLSSDELAGRAPGMMGDRTTRAYLEERFECLGLTPIEQGCFSQPFHNGDGDHTANIVGLIPGSDPAVADEIIVVGGHHDHLGTEFGTIYNGANDNVSGVVALLAIAQGMLELETPPRRTIAFVAFASEEYGLEGSDYFVDNPPPEVPMDDVVYMINLDMLGTYDVVGGVDAFGTFDGTPGRIALDESLADHAGLNVTTNVASPEGDSDYDPFCDAEIPYVYFETFDPPCWHEGCDDFERMDFEHMSELAHIKFDVIASLASTETDLVAAKAEFGCMREAAMQAPPKKHHHFHPNKKQRHAARMAKLARGE